MCAVFSPTILFVNNSVEDFMWASKLWKRETRLYQLALFPGTTLNEVELNDDNTRQLAYNTLFCLYVFIARDC